MLMFQAMLSPHMHSKRLLGDSHILAAHWAYPRLWLCPFVLQHSTMHISMPKLWLQQAELSYVSDVGMRESMSDVQG